MEDRFILPIIFPLYVHYYITDVITLFFREGTEKLNGEKNDKLCSQRESL